MGVGVVADLVTGGDQPAQRLRLLAGDHADDEEGALGVVALEVGEHVVHVPRARAVVEGQGDHLARGGRGARDELAGHLVRPRVHEPQRAGGDCDGGHREGDRAAQEPAAEAARPPGCEPPHTEEHDGEHGHREQAGDDVQVQHEPSLQRVCLPGEPPNGQSDDAAAARAPERYTVRAATEADAPALAACARAAYAKYVERNGLVPVPMRQDYAEVVRDWQVTVVEQSTARSRRSS